MRVCYSVSNYKFQLLNYVNAWKFDCIAGQGRVLALTVIMSPVVVSTWLLSSCKLLHHDYYYIIITSLLHVYHDSSTVWLI